MPTTLTITLYNDDDEPRQTYAALRVPWRLVKAAEDFCNRADSMIAPDDQAGIQALVVEVFGGQFTLDELVQGARLEEMAAVVLALVTKYGRPLELQPADVDQLLVGKLGWSLRDLDETDAGSLVRFLEHLPEAKTKAEPKPAAKPVPQPNQKFADEVDWL